MPCGGGGAGAGAGAGRPSAGGNRHCIGDDVGDGVGATAVPLALALALAVANGQWLQMHCACVQHGYHLR